MPHAILFSDRLATIDPNTYPIHDVAVIGVVETVEEAIRAIAKDFAQRNRDDHLVASVYPEGEVRDPDLWFLRAAGQTGDELHAGIGWKTNVFYRAVPLQG